MKRILFLCMMLVAIGANAQTNLAGRIYHHPNIMADEMNKLVKEGTTEMEKARKEAIAKGEEKKGRKLTEKELAELDKQLAEAKKMMEALKKGMKVAITVTFSDEKKLVMKMDTKIDDDVMKAAGIPWAKRKLMKAAMAMAPSSQKGTYTVSGNNIYVQDGKELDTLRLSDDGKYLYGKMDEKTKFKLTRTK